MIYSLYNDLYILNDTGYSVELLSETEIKIVTPDYTIFITSTDNNYLKLTLETPQHIRYMGSVSTYAVDAKNLTVLVSVALGQIVAFAEMGGID